MIRVIKMIFFIFLKGFAVMNRSKKVVAMRAHIAHIGTRMMIHASFIHVCLCVREYALHVAWRLASLPTSIVTRRDLYSRFTSLSLLPPRRIQMRHTLRSSQSKINKKNFNKPNKILLEKNFKLCIKKKYSRVLFNSVLLRFRDCRQRKNVLYKHRTIFFFVVVVVFFFHQRLRICK